MSNYNMMDSVKPELLAEEVYSIEKASHCLMPMGITSENVAKEFGVTRQEQDELAESSHKKAAHA